MISSYDDDRRLGSVVHVHMEFERMTMTAWGELRCYARELLWGWRKYEAIQPENWDDLRGFGWVENYFKGNLMKFQEILLKFNQKSDF